jgi:hypothetical protein
MLVQLSKHLYQGPQSDRYITNWVEEQPDDLIPSLKNEEERKKHTLVVKHKKNTEGEIGLHIHFIKVQSPLLKSVLKQVFHKYQACHSPTSSSRMWNFANRSGLLCTDGMNSQQLPTSKETQM